MLNNKSKKVNPNRLIPFLPGWATNLDRIGPKRLCQNGLYFLTNLDQNIVVIIRIIYCFKSDSKGNKESAEIIKDALLKVLVHSYLSGVCFFHLIQNFCLA